MLTAIPTNRFSRGNLLIASLLFAATADAEWTLIWSDEFDYQGTPDPAKWNIREWPPGRVNGELQAYTDRRKNLRVERGHLVIEAHADPEHAFTSARIDSRGKRAMTYGRIEARIRFPAARGTWAAFWMMPSDASRFGRNEEEGWYWPNSGEIDIAEHVGFRPDAVHAAVHSKAAYFKQGNHRRDLAELPGGADLFRVYAVEWFEDRMEFFVDDRAYFEVENKGRGWEWWPFNHDFHVILNLAVGGSWGGRKGVDRDAFPQKMLVDYVRVFEPDG